jgi:hypothetical protein
MSRLRRDTAPRPYRPSTDPRGTSALGERVASLSAQREELVAALDLTDPFQSSRCGSRRPGSTGWCSSRWYVSSDVGANR